MDKVWLPRDHLISRCKETKNPTSSRIRYNDTSAVALEIFVFSAIFHGYIGGDKKWIEKLAELAYQIFPTPWKNTWHHILHNVFETKRRVKKPATVQARPPAPDALLSIGLTFLSACFHRHSP